MNKKPLATIFIVRDVHGTGVNYTGYPVRV